ncbi:MAG: prephenate dehydrogenase/arogenate dehydrogenase family protein [Methanomassiliicoccaceae archaeon]|nr:prephenate dehydrogenase/arogenate dehydrogenase family protein [Methanomassiliicoccaceae archaeon]
MSEELGSLRERIREIDAQIMKLIAERNGTAGMIGELKKELSIPLRNLSVENEIIKRYRDSTNGTQLPADAAESVARTLITASVELQSVMLRKRCAKNVTVVGGDGKMGKWMVDYFKSKGADVNVIDVSTGSINDLTNSDIVVISVPISSASGVLADADRLCRKDALIFDISSVKSPFTAKLKEMAEHRNVCSVHPMFGPSAVSMTGRNILICNCGCTKAAEDAALLFDDDDANVVMTSVERHDVLMSYVLALAHASNIAFFTALRGSDISFDELRAAGSATFERTLNASIPVASENAELYHEIQRLNVNAEDMWNTYEKAFASVRDASLSDDPERFSELMKDGRRYLEGL